MHFLFYFVVLLQILSALSYNIDVRQDATKTIQPYPHDSDSAIENPIFFGYDLSIKVGSSDTPRYSNN